MSVNIRWQDKISEEHPSLSVIYTILKNVNIQKKSVVINEIETEYYSRIKNNFDLDNIKNDKIIRAYRDFYWKIGIDPTKTRPASEALIRRILGNKQLWRINTFVDSYNIASAVSKITLGAYDISKIKENENLINLIIREANYEEEFKGIGMKESKYLKKGEIVLTDDKILSIYPYRDAERTKIQTTTKKILLIGYGVPNISEQELKYSLDLTIEIFRKMDKNFQYSNYGYSFA